MPSNPIPQQRTGAGRCASLALAILGLSQWSFAAAPASTPASAPRTAAPSAALSSHAGASAPAQHAKPSDSRKHRVPPAKPPAPVDINSATAAALRSLPGIGSAEAARIVAGRPYLTNEDLVTKKVLPLGLYQQLRHRMVALPKHATKGGA